ncbi:peptidase [Synechococcus phage S-CBWM1]|uniref:Peptidase n=1 Tax=Synechococcus phage S-CBWM1 TaxID=2053653 RepID=A0A3G1L3V1_9CAUD|nr:head maturation protease [Synechococcus phage S-CBWM1]ATW62854.1 peptidase [Synechococcus phage S-CBWM1]
MIKKIHVFTAGPQTSSGGVSKEFTEDMLAEAASSYDPAVHDAPLVIGHSGDNDSVPSFGWAKKFEVQDGKMYAKVDLTEAAEDLVEKKHYKKVSISFYPPESPVNPHPGKWSVRHIALLGASPPAVKGLEAFKFGEVEGETISFSDSSLTLGDIVDEDLGPSMINEEGPLEVLEKALNEARKEQESEGDETKTASLEENLDDQGAADAESAAQSDTNQQFTEMPKAIASDEQLIDSQEVEESPVDEALEEVMEHSEETPAMPEATETAETADHSEGEEGQKEEEMEEGEEGEEPSEEMKEEAPKKKRRPRKKAKAEEEKDPEEFACGDKEEEEKNDYAELREQLEQLRQEKEELIKEFKEEQAKVRKEKIAAEVSHLYGEGQLTDAIISEDSLVSFCEGLEFGTLEFSEGETAATKLLGLLNRLPKMVEFREVVSEKRSKSMEFSEMDLHSRAIAIASAEDLEYAEALKKAVTGYIPQFD